MGKHFHLYVAGARDRKRGPPRMYCTTGLGYWSRSDANREKRGRDAFVRQCELTDCVMKERYPDDRRGDPDRYRYSTT